MPTHDPILNAALVVLLLVVVVTKPDPPAYGHVSDGYAVEEEESDD